MLGHSVEVNHRTYVHAFGDALERERARDALVDLGLGVTPTSQEAERPEVEAA